MCNKVGEMSKSIIIAGDFGLALLSRPSKPNEKIHARVHKHRGVHKMWTTWTVP